MYIGMCICLSLSIYLYIYIYIYYLYRETERERVVTCVCIIYIYIYIYIYICLHTLIYCIGSEVERPWGSRNVACARCGETWSLEHASTGLPSDNKLLAWRATDVFTGGGVIISAAFLPWQKVVRKV